MAELLPILESLFGSLPFFGNCSMIVKISEILK